MISAGDPYGLYNAHMERNPRGGMTRSGQGTPSDPFRYAPKKDMGEEPVNFVSFYDAVRFTNWLRNDQGHGDTETGAYLILNGGPDSGQIGERAPGATWFLPTEDEWYKAAYFDPAGEATGAYWLFPTRSNTLITPQRIERGSIPATRPEATDSGSLPALPDAVVGSAVPSFYRTLYQGERVREWSETPIGAERCIRGGSWRCPMCALALERASAPSGHQDDHTGFRVACRHPRRGSADRFGASADESANLSIPRAARFKLPGGLGGGLLPADLHLSGGGGPGSDTLFHRDPLSHDDLIPGPTDQEDVPPFDGPETNQQNADGDSQFTPDPSVNNLDNPVLPPPGAPPEPTPEPSTLWLLLFGTACLRRRR